MRKVKGDDDMQDDGIPPVVVYHQEYLDELHDEVREAKEKIASGEQPVFDSVDALLAKLEE